MIFARRVGGVRHGWLGLIVLAVVASGAGCSLVRPGSYTVRFSAPGVASTTVTVPGSAGKPAVTVSAAPTPKTLPPGVTPLSLPVRVEADTYKGTATITMTYDPAALPAGTVTDDLAVYVFVPDLGVWLPAGDEVDTAAHTVAAVTEHLSEWMLAITDPAKLRYEQQLTDALRKTVGGRIAGLMYGEPQNLTCDAKRLLVAAAVRSDLLLPPAKLCEHILDDGGYELQWVNTTELPVVFDLPAGFAETTTDLRLNPMLQGVLQQHNHPRGAIVLPGRSLTIRFAGAAVAPGTTIRGEIDWSVYLIAMARQLVEIALFNGASDDPKTRDRIDGAFEKAEIADCFAEAGNELQESGDILKAVKKGVTECTGPIAGELLKLAVKTGLKSLKALKKFLGKRLDVLTSLSDLMSFARSEIAGLLALPGALTGKLDTSVTVAPSRVMTYDEAMQLPVAVPTAGTTGCGAWPVLPFLPAGMPVARLCGQSIDADLNGNGKPDRLLTWRPPVEHFYEPLDRKVTGAVAYLDDGSFHVLENQPAGWQDLGPGPDIEQMGVFDVADVVHFGGDARAQALITVALGSSTNYHVVLSVADDGRLRAATLDGHIATVFDGGAAAYGSSYGCVLSQGKPLVVQSTRGSDPLKPDKPSDWTRKFYTFDGRALTLVGADEGAALRANLPTAGSNCNQAGVAQRGPEIGPVKPK